MVNLPLDLILLMFRGQKQKSSIFVLSSALSVYTCTRQGIQLRLGERCAHPNKSFENERQFYIRSYNLSNAFHFERLSVVWLCHIVTDHNGHRLNGIRNIATLTYDTREANKSNHRTQRDNMQTWTNSFLLCGLCVRDVFLFRAISRYSITLCVPYATMHVFHSQFTSTKNSPSHSLSFLLLCSISLRKRKTHSLPRRVASLPLSPFSPWSLKTQMPLPFSGEPTKIIAFCLKVLVGFLLSFCLSPLSNTTLLRLD